MVDLQRKVALNVYEMLAHGNPLYQAETEPHLEQRSGENVMALLNGKVALPKLPSLFGGT
ncbi:MAG TPA: hypothetical protein VGM23_17200 [Armatimonadota bacterium]